MKIATLENSKRGMRDGPRGTHHGDGARPILGSVGRWPAVPGGSPGTAPIHLHSHPKERRWLAGLVGRLAGPLLDLHRLLTRWILLCASLAWAGAAARRLRGVIRPDISSRHQPCVGERGPLACRARRQTPFQRFNVLTLSTLHPLCLALFALFALVRTCSSREKRKKSSRRPDGIPRLYRLRQRRFARLDTRGPPLALCSYQFACFVLSRAGVSMRKPEQRLL